VIVVNLVFGISLAGFGSVGLFWTVRELIRSWLSRRWPVGEAEIVSSSVHERRGRRGRTVFEPTVSYAYSFAGREHVGHRIAFGDVSSGNREEADQVANRFEVGTRWAVSVCGRKPDLSVLHPGPNRRVWFAAAFFSLYVAMAVSFLLDTVRRLAA
jgi:uncharacterized protein DUF3592